MATQALILIGDLRFKDSAHFEQFKSFFSGYDIFISTYEDHEKLCAKLTSTYLLQSRDIEMDLKRERINSKGAVLQWFHLDQILKTYGSQLLEYDVLVKVRSDMVLTDLSRKSLEESPLNVDKDTMYMRSDVLFYARSAHFIKTLKDFYPKIRTFYWGNPLKYIPLNYDNILNSEDGCTPHNVRFVWLTLPDVLTHSRKEKKGDFLALKRLIKEHYDFLADFNSLNHPLPLPHPMDMQVECLRYFTPNFDFSSEQALCIESFNAGLVKNSLIFTYGLMRGRRAFKFDPDDPPTLPRPLLQWPTAR